MSKQPADTKLLIRMLLSSQELPKVTRVIKHSFVAACLSPIKCVLSGSWLIHLKDFKAEDGIWQFVSETDWINVQIPLFQFRLRGLHFVCKREEFCLGPMHKTAFKFISWGMVALYVWCFHCIFMGAHCHWFWAHICYFLLFSLSFEL